MSQLGKSNTLAGFAGSTLNDGLLDVMYAMDLSQEQVSDNTVA